MQSQQLILLGIGIWLLEAAISDLRTRTILLWPMLFLGGSWILFVAAGWLDLDQQILQGIMGGGVIWIGTGMSKGKVGTGDGGACFVLGSYLGISALMKILVYGLFFGGLLALFCLIQGKKEEGLPLTALFFPAYLLYLAGVFGPLIP